MSSGHGEGSPGLPGGGIAGKIHHGDGEEENREVNSPPRRRTRSGGKHQSTHSPLPSHHARTSSTVSSAATVSLVPNLASSSVSTGPVLKDLSSFTIQVMKHR